MWVNNCSKSTINRGVLKTLSKIKGGAFCEQKTVEIRQQGSTMASDKDTRTGRCFMSFLLKVKCVCSTLCLPRISS